MPTPPGYFFHDANVNRMGYQKLDSLIEKSMKPLSVEEFKNLVSQGYKIIDSRDKLKFLEGFIVGSYSIDYKGAFASWVGKLLSPTDKYVFITEEG